MGFTPAQVDAMTIWEFLACSDGYAESHGAKKKQQHGDMDENDLIAMGVEGF